MRILYALLLVCLLALTTTLAAQDCPSDPTGLPTPTNDLELTLLGSYATGIFDESAAEIVAYDSTSRRLFFTNADADEVVILDISDPASPTLVREVGPVTDNLGGINSVAVFDGLVAAAFEGASEDSPGEIIVMNTDGQILRTFVTGALPDMVTFSPDGNYLLTANEGQPNDDYTVDPEGSVTVVDLSNGVDNAVTTTVGFEAFNRQRARLTLAGVRIFGPNASVARDLEPEYITVAGDQAYVTLQENNAFAILDLPSLTFTDIVPFGYKDNLCAANGFDGSDRDDTISIRPQPTLAIYQPDGTASFTQNGVTYIITANEGDSRDYDGFSEEVRVADLLLDTMAYPNADTLQMDENLGRLRTTNAFGDVDCDGDIDQIYTYGGRSFSIFTTDGTLVYDSGSEFERILAELDPDNFNSNNDENDSAESRSDDKGPEPEAVEIARIDGRMYALIGLERVGGIFIYDITDPENPFYVSYANNRNFSVDATVEIDSMDTANPDVGDLGVEDVLFIPAAQSPNGENLVVTANEVSGSVSLFGIAAPTFTLRLVHNNDGESKIVADTLDNGLAFGGAARFVTIVDSLRADTLPTVVLSSGDNYLPGPAFNASLARGPGLPLYDSEVLNAIGYDAIVIGNHDFDFGPDILERVILETAPSGPTFLSANLDFSGEPGLLAFQQSGRIAGREIVTIGGEEVGVVGLTTPELRTISSPRGVTVDSAVVAIAQSEVDVLLASGINKIILISHLQSINEELALAGQLTGVDVIIAGGGDELLTNDSANALGGLEVDDTYPIDTLDADGNTVYVVTTPGEYRYVGNLVVEFSDEGEVLRIADESDVIPVTGSTNRDAAVSMIEDSILAYNAGLETNIIARTEVDLDGLRASVRTMETNQGNLVTDAYLWFFDRVRNDFNFSDTLPVIALQNGGGMRDDEVIAAGSDISELKTFDILPFSNFVSVLEPISPEALRSVMENSVSRVGDRSGRFLQVAGFTVVYDTAQMADVNRIVNITLDDGTPIVAGGRVVDGAPDVYIVTNSFTANGGDGYDEFEELDFVNIGPSYQRVLFEYLIAEDGLNAVVTATEYPAGGEGRITIDALSNNDNLNLEDYDWTIAPNPFGNNLSVGFRLPAAEAVAVRLYDLGGRQVATLTDSRLSAGYHSLELSTGNLPTGSYVLRVSIGDRVAASQVIKQ